MPRAIRGPATLLVAAALAACSPGGPVVTVDVRTDFAPGTELTATHVTLDATSRDHATAAGEDWLAGVRVAEFDPVARGAHTVDVALVSGTRTLATRRVALSVSGNVALTVVVTRTCAGLACPRPGDPADATTCVNGACASPACGQPGGPACPDCHLDSDCPASPVACAPSRCTAGSCLRTPDATSCGPAMSCDPGSGCIATGDAGPPDASTDAGADLGVDAGTDLGVDAGTDLGVDAGTDLGVDSGSPGHTGCRACAHDSDCATGFACTYDPGGTGTELDCFPLRAAAGTCTPYQPYSRARDTTSIDGTFSRFCLPSNATCPDLRSFGIPCPSGTECGTDTCVTSTHTCSYACTMSIECPTACDVGSMGATFCR